MKKLMTIGGESPSNGGAATLEASAPYTARITIRGVAPILFHAWNCESVETKAKAAKGSKAKKTDDVESYVHRNDEGEICVPGSYLRGAIVEAGRYSQDPRSPRKSARDLYKAMIHAVTDLASLGSKEWDYLDQRRVALNKVAITRSRPAFKEGWECTIDLLVCDGSFVPPERLLQEVTKAGQLVGVGDFRPTFGRFGIARFELLQEEKD